jgi:phenylalanyl-tRNA synthetase beta chain
MPTTTLNRKTFEELTGKKLTTQELQDKIPMLGTSLESIDEKEITIEACPNRPDFLSEQGFARAFSAFIGIKTGLRKYPVEKSGEKIIIDKTAKNTRPYTACAIIKGIKFDDEKIKEAIQIQEKLHITYGRNRKKAAIGIYPLEKIKFPITFFAEEPQKIRFRPLEHPTELSGQQILNKHPAGREYAHLMEGMAKFAFFKDADGKILSMPPIINSHDTGKISEKTKDIFIECSGFDFEYLKTCLNIIATAFADMGGKIYSLELDYSGKKETTPDLTPKEWKISAEYINKRLGLKLTESQIKELLAKMGHEYKNGIALAPAYRADIMHPVDFAEETAIAYGYENFTPEIPRVSTTGEENQLEKLKRKISEILTGLGLLETETYNLTSEEHQNKKMNTKHELIELSSAVNTDYNTLRAWMIPSLMDVLERNKNREYPQKIFGTGTTFKKGNTETGIEEKEKLTAAICEEKADYTKIKQILDYLMRMLDLPYKTEETEHPSFITGRTAKITIHGKELGIIGELHPKILTNWSIENPTAALEIDVNEIMKILS